MRQVEFDQLVDAAKLVLGAKQPQPPREKLGGKLLFVWEKEILEAPPRGKWSSNSTIFLILIV